jgi:hypothetical protein
MRRRWGYAQALPFSDFWSTCASCSWVRRRYGPARLDRIELLEESAGAAAIDAVHKAGQLRERNAEDPDRA